MKKEFSTYEENDITDILWLLALPGLFLFLILVSVLMHFFS